MNLHGQHAYSSGYYESEARKWQCETGYIPQGPKETTAKPDEKIQESEAKKEDRTL